ncbi:accessory Sec system protein Asp2 [Glutamicibacter ardleyensis]|uniref:accessory Sec system protein Asp2 n=1 Tax=Glutamicibacter ardleyensis TaxID=225894 RepID=UPI003FD5876B
MKSISEIYNYNNIDIQYKLQLPRKDRRHLLVIFSGGFIGGYDFDGESFTKLNCAILWIRDELNTYYIQYKGNDTYQYAVNSLIETKISELGLSRDEVTLLGLSKGGTGALYHGLNFNFRNIVISVPRIKPAIGNLENRPEMLENLLDGISSDKVRAFDELLPSLLASSAPEKNIYLFSSVDDDQYKTEIAPNLSSFRRYANFNYVETHSTNVRQHEDVSLYNLPLISSVISFLIDGIAPRYGEVSNGIYSKIDRKDILPEISKLKNHPVVSIESLSLQEDGFYIRGRAFLMYNDAKNYGSVKRQLILSSASDNLTIQLGGLKDRRNNRDFSQATGHDYNAGSYATPGNLPFDLETLAFGHYQCEIRLQQNKISYRADTFEGKPSTYLRVFNGYAIKSSFKSGSLTISKIPLRDYGEYKGIIRLSELTIKSGKLFVKGSCRLDNVDYSSWEDVQYKLVFISRLNPKNTASIDLAKNKGRSSFYPWRIPNVEVFTTSKDKGTAVPTLDEDTYDVLLLANVKDYLFVADLHRSAIVKNKGSIEFINPY